MFKDDQQIYYNHLLLIMTKLFQNSGVVAFFQAIWTSSYDLDNRLQVSNFCKASGMCFVAFVAWPQNPETSRLRQKFCDLHSPAAQELQP